MPLALTTEQVENYHRDGFASPFRVLSEEQAADYRARFEAYEKANGGWYELSKGQKLYLLQTWVAELARNPRVLDGVQDVLGTDILCWGCSLFVKEAQHPGYVSWHQDSTYWGLSKPDVTTAWIALSPASELSGCMKMLPGSHTQQQMPHNDTLAANNLLTRGQEIAVDVNEAQAQLLPLQAGEMSLHNIRTVHASKPNQSDDRRIGLAIRYITPQVRQIEAPKDSAWLLRGEDNTGNWIHETPPHHDMDADALREHERIMSLRQAVLYKNIEGQPAHTNLDASSSGPSSAQPYRRGRSPMKRISSPLALAALLLLVGLIYLPGLNGPPLLDDGNNLAPLGAIENGTLSIGEYVFGSREGALSRPVSNASFMVNWLLWGDNLMAFKAVNVLVHILCGVVVFFLARALLGIAYTQLEPRTIAAAALFTCAMWLLAPLFVSTVLYTVQRMAQLCALFTLLGLLCYVLGRQRRSALLLVAAFVMWPLALFSKENGALLPLLAALIEWWWLPGAATVRADNKAQGSNAIDQWTRRTRIALIGCISFTAVALIIKVAGEPSWLLGGYQGRDFSMTERLITQGPVLLDYLGNLLLFPGSNALSVFRDDFPVARDLWTRPLTAVACLLWIAVLVAGICYRRHRSLMHAVSFGMLFFLAAHLVESSVLPLELYFEHRNYLPAFGIFLALTSCGLWLPTRGTPRLIALLAVALVVLSALATLQRTVLWGNEANLYAHATRTHPQSARAWLGLASIQFTHDRFEDAQRSLHHAALLMQPSAHAAIALQAIAAHCVARREVPQSLWLRLHAAPLLASDLFTSNALAWMAGAFRAGTCDAATQRGVRQILGELPSAPASWNATVAQLRDAHLRQVLGSP